MRNGKVAVLVAGGLAVLVVVAGCGAADEPTAVTPTPGGSGPLQTQPKPSNEPNKCLGDPLGTETPPNSGPETDGFLGLTERAAKQYAAENNQTIRIAGRDGKCFPLTMDYRRDRVNLYLENDVVVAATIG